MPPPAVGRRPRDAEEKQETAGTDPAAAAE